MPASQLAKNFKSLTSSDAELRIFEVPTRREASGVWDEQACWPFFVARTGERDPPTRPCRYLASACRPYSGDAVNIASIPLSRRALRRDSR